MQSHAPQDRQNLQNADIERLDICSVKSITAAKAAEQITVEVLTKGLSALRWL